MEKTNVHFTFLCFISTALLSLVASEYKLYNSRSLSKHAGVHYAQSADARETDIEYLLNNKCKFFLAEKTIFYACPKRPTRYPALQREVFRYDNRHDDRGEETHSLSEKFECPFPFGTYPHPIHCRKYYLCIFDKPRTMTCDSSKLYDEYENECAEKSTVDCGDRTGGVSTKGTTQAPGQKTTSAVKTTTKKVQKFKCPYTWGTFPNPDDCSQYYLCLNKRHTVKKCKPKELYDTEENECRDENKVDCGSRYNPREKTTKLPETTAATTARPTTSVTTTKEEITSDTSGQETSQSPSADTSDQGLTEEVSPSSETKTTITDETEGTAGKITSEEPAESTAHPAITDDDSSETGKPEPTSEEPKITDDDSSETGKPESTSEEPKITDDDSSETGKPEPTPKERKITDDDTSDSGESEQTSAKPEVTDNNVSDEPEITDENTSGTGEVEPSTEKPIITDGATSDTKEPESTSDNSDLNDNDTSESDQLESTSENPQNTDNDIVDTDEPELISEESSEVTEATSQPTVEDSSISEDPDTKDGGKLATTAEDNLTEEPLSTKNDVAPETTENDTPSKGSETPLEETTPSELRSSVPEDNSKEVSTGGEKETEEESTSPQPESTGNDATTAEEHITPEVSQATTDGKGISSGDEVETSPATSSELPKLFVCPRKKGNFPHKDCSLYYACRQGVYTIETCPQGTLFHLVYGMCDNEDNVDCGDRERPDKDETVEVTPDGKTISSGDEVETSPATSSELPKLFVCPKKKGNFPHKDCSLYYACRQGDYTIETCPQGTLFHLVYGMCDNEDNVDCGDRERPDKGEQTTLTDTSSSASPTAKPMTETVADIDISSEISKSFENTDKTLDYTSSVVSETISTLDYTTERTDSTSDFDNNDLTSTGNTENFETSTSKTDGIDYETSETFTGDEVVETSESQSTSVFSTQEITYSTEGKTSAVSNENYSTGEPFQISSTADNVTKQSISPTHGENIETSADDNTEKSSGIYSTEPTSETTASYRTEDTSYVSIWDEISVETTTDFVRDKISTQNTDDDKEQQGTSEATEETNDSSTEDQRTSFISETTHSDSQEETTVDYTDVSITGTDTVSQTGNTGNIEEATSSSIGDDEISTKSTATFRTNEPSSQSSTDDEETSDKISTVGTTSEEVVNEVTSSERPISTEQESTSFMPETTQPNSDESIVSETTEAESHMPSETTQDNFSSSTETSTIIVLDTTSRSPEEISSTVRPKEVCRVTDEKCIADENGNVFRCPKSHGHFPHPWNKSKFLHCDNFRIHVIDCPAGLRFDPVHGICTWAAAG